MNCLHRLLYELRVRVKRRREVPCHYHEGDVLLASFPKSGNTWMRFILANISRVIGGHEGEVDFHTVHLFCPEIARNRSLEGVARTEGFPLFLKTHLPWVSQYRRWPALLIVRNPADVMASYHHSLTEEHGLSFRDISAFVRHWRYGAAAWERFHLAWRGRQTVLLRYEDLLADAACQVAAALEQLGCDVPDDVVRHAVELSSRENMRKALADRGDPCSGNPEFQFVGTAPPGDDDGTGPQSLSQADRETIRRQCSQCIDWLGY